MENLPEFTPDMPITITHGPIPLRHIVEKSVTLNVGESRSFHFTDGYGDEVQCHINNVTLIDVWKDTEEQWNDSRLAERLSPEQLEQARKHSYDALKQNCPKGMCLKPDKKTGTHGLPLKGCVIQTPVPPETVKISAELFMCFEMVKAWTERVL